MFRKKQIASPKIHTFINVFNDVVYFYFIFFTKIKIINKTKFNRLYF